MTIQARRHLIPGIPLIIQNSLGQTVYAQQLSDSSPSVDTDFVLYIDSNNEAACVSNNGEFRLSLSEGNVIGVATLDNSLKWIIDKSGTRIIRKSPLRCTANIRQGISKLVCFFGNGQSQEAARSSYPIIHQDSVDSGRAFRFNGGVRPLGSQSTPEVDIEVDYQEIINLAPLKEIRQGNDGETIYSSFAESLIPDLTDNEGIMCVTAGIGAQAYAELCRGQAPFTNLSHYVGRMALICELLGLEFEIGGFMWCQGGADSGDTVSEYLTKMQNYYDDCQDIAAMVNQTDVPLFLSQMTHNSTTDMTVARAQLQASLDETRNIYCVCPEYIFPSCHDEYNQNVPGVIDDTTHISSRGQSWRGAYYARCVSSVRSAIAYEPLRCISATRSGTLVDLAFNISAPNIVPPLILGNSHIDDPENYGFTWIDDGDGNSVTITNVELISENEAVRLTLSAEPTGANPKIGIATSASTNTPNYQGPIEGARSSVHDSSTDVKIISGVSHNMYNFLSSNLIDVVI